MRRHLAYLRYLLRHKWYVLRSCGAVGAPLGLGLVHDLSKFRPCEWGPYARQFYQVDGSKKPYVSESEEFLDAWRRHQKMNPHHWQFWLVHMDRGEVIPLEMPEKYAREMVADWVGAGWAITGKREGVFTWYEKNREKMTLHPKTRVLVEQVLNNRLRQSGVLASGS